MITGVATTASRVAPSRLPWWASIADVLGRARDGIGVIDTSLRLTFWNRAASVLTGAPAAAMIGAGCTIAGNVLTVDLSRQPPGPANGAGEEGPHEVRLCALRITTPAGGRTVANVVATLIPVRCENVYCFVHLSPKAAAYPAISSAPDGLPAALTDREREILVLLAGGKTAKPIASELSVSLPTVRTHIRHILRKLGVHSCLEAAVWLLRNGPAGRRHPGAEVWANLGGAARPLSSEGTSFV